MKPRFLASFFIAACLALAAAPIDALAESAHLAEIAAGGVVAVQSQSGVRTGFAFGKANLVIASTSINAGVHLITAHGVSAEGNAKSRYGELVAVHAPGLNLRPLRRSEVRETSSGTLAYVLGAPLGYEGEPIRAVRLPALKLDGTRTVLIGGKLPKLFQGGPVVTRGGRVIGAVAAVGGTSWTLALQLRLSRLTAVDKTSGGEGVPVIPLLVGVLIMIVVLAGLIAKRRRRRSSTESTPVVVRHRGMEDLAHTLVRDPTQHFTEPLVRRRGSDIDDDEDFDIIFKSHEDNEPS
jgi:hypothetical protein